MRQSLLSQMFQLTATQCVFRPSVKAPKIGSPLAADRLSQRVQPNRSKTCLSLRWPQVLAVCMWQRAQALASYMSNMACTHSLSWQKLVIPRCHLLDMCDDALDPVYVFLENSLVMPAGIPMFLCSWLIGSGCNLLCQDAMQGGMATGFQAHSNKCTPDDCFGQRIL